jgi:hypothetical protein
LPEATGHSTIALFLLAVLVTAWAATTVPSATL